MSSRALGFSLIIPLYNEEETIPLLKERLPQALEAFESWEVIFVDDGSRDRTLKEILQWNTEDDRIKVVELSRNFGHQRAVLSGLSVASGEIIGIIDGDLQDPPELLFRMAERVKAGVDVVYGVRQQRKEGPFLKFSYWMTYRVINMLSDTQLPLDSGDFCVMHRRVVDEMLKLNEQSLYLRGLRAWVGFSQEPFPYERSARAAGEPKYRLKQLIRLAHNGLFSFTKVPLRFLSVIGLLTVSFSAIYSIYILTARLFGQPMPEGFLTLILAVMFFSGVQLVALGVLGEYIGRIFDQSRARPLFIIKHFHQSQGR